MFWSRWVWYRNMRVRVASWCIFQTCQRVGEWVYQVIRASPLTMTLRHDWQSLVFRRSFCQHLCLTWRMRSDVDECLGHEGFVAVSGSFRSNLVGVNGPQEEGWVRIWSTRMICPRLPAFSGRYTTLPIGNRLEVSLQHIFELESLQKSCFFCEDRIKLSGFSLVRHRRKFSSVYVRCTYIWCIESRWHWLLHLFSDETTRNKSARLTD